MRDVNGHIRRLFRGRSGAEIGGYATSHQRLVPTKLAFVIYRRDLASSAPTQVFVRVVAQVEREMKFNVAGPPTLEKIEGQWAIHSKSYEFNVAPIDDNPEMVVLHPEDPNLVLSAGRYALAIAGNGYDFSAVSRAHQCRRRDGIF